MRDPRSLLRVGDQLELDLFPGEPWGGRSPRGLTKVGKGLFLRPEPPGHEGNTDILQLSLWPVKAGHSGRGPQAAPGAPSLLPLKPRRKGVPARRLTLLRRDDA